MNWYRRYKLAFPYSENLCPHCSRQLLLDFYWEKEGTPHKGIGKCSYCKKAFKVEEYEQQQGLAFHYSGLEPISNFDFNKLKLENWPVVLVAPRRNEKVEKTNIPPEKIEENLLKTSVF